MQHLVIVESPTKAKTITKFLDKAYRVESSFGHVRDLPKTKLGVDVEHNFEPQYVVPPRARKTVTELKKIAAKSDTVLFATDEDREGEAISWHLAELLDVPEKKIKRIVFHEITEDAILEALENPRGIDVNLVNAQQARRVLDRLVGYELSPFLWKKVARGLSAGRVQSVAVRLIVEREREINAFVAEEYWTIDGTFITPAKPDMPFAAKLHSIDGETLQKMTLKTNEETAEIVKRLQNADYQIASVETRQSKRNPSAPFTTSTLQQEANHRLGFSAKQTMMLAQQLYEGVELGGRGAVGLITYMRTDSVNLATKFLTEAQKYIHDTFGARYTTGPRMYKAKSKLAQEAHEAIRPTSAAHDPASIKEHLDARQFRLYQLIWQRAMASQMTEAQIGTTRIDIAALKTPYQFRASGSVIVFDGFLKVYPTDAKESVLPAVKEKEAVTATTVIPNQHFTQPPARYSEASLVKILEEYGIGRPSTYAPTIATVQDRGYVLKEEGRLRPTDIALVVTDLLVEHFPQIVDYQFTATMEDDLDTVAEGKKNWVTMMKEFYTPFHELLSAKEETIVRSDVIGTREVGIDPTSGKPIIVKVGRFGPYVQKGSKDDDVKPTFASIPKNLSIETITLEQALKLFELPRVVGTDSAGNEIISNTGRFGPYLKVEKTYYSIKDGDPYTITLDEALPIIAEGNNRKAQKTIKSFEGSDVEILNGRYGPYITNGEANARIPKGTEAETLTLEQCEQLLKDAPQKQKRGYRRPSKAKIEKTAKAKKEPKGE